MTFDNVPVHRSGLKGISFDEWAKKFYDTNAWVPGIVPGLRKLQGEVSRLVKISLKNADDRIEVNKLRLVSARVVSLSLDHKKGRVRNKNMNRIRRELRIYEKRNG